MNNGRKLPAGAVLNRAPIFLNCLSRGGSNILWNVFLSHPLACSPIRETLEIFRLDWRAPTLAGLRLALLTGQPRLFDQWKLAPRRTVTRGGQRFIDRVLYAQKLRTLTDVEMRFKAPGEVYSPGEVAAARLVAKNNNGLAFLTEQWLELYPDACFFALVRHPVPLYESHRRRGISRSPDAFLEFFGRVTHRMLEDAARYERYHIVRFEDLLARPLETIERLYRLAKLDFDQLRSLRFKCKPHLQKDGVRGTPFLANHHRWFAPAEVGEFLERDINQLQSDQLPDRERQLVTERSEAICHALGYG